MSSAESNNDTAEILKRVVFTQGHVHLREQGRMFAPCGATVAGGKHTPKEKASPDVVKVTCPQCRARIREIGAAYASARRRKAIDW